MFANGARFREGIYTTFFSAKNFLISLLSMNSLHYSAHSNVAVIIIIAAAGGSLSLSFRFFIRMRNTIYSCHFHFTFGVTCVIKLFPTPLEKINTILRLHLVAQKRPPVANLMKALFINDTL